jgi:hypothetical protein
MKRDPPPVGSRPLRACDKAGAGGLLKPPESDRSFTEGTWKTPRIPIVVSWQEDATTDALAAWLIPWAVR